MHIRSAGYERSLGDTKQNLYVFDPENPAELARLINQDRLITKAMGGPLAGLPDPSSWDAILDVACGPGGWVLDVAFDHPTIEVAGVDLCQSMIEYAWARARSQCLSNASFGVMDITQSLDFSDATFDLVNARFLIGVLHRDIWQPFLAECRRVLKPGGVLRLVETEDIGHTNSPAYQRLSSLGAQAMARMDYGMASETLLLTPFLLEFLQEVGYRNVQRQYHTLDFSREADGWFDQFCNAILITLQAQPMIRERCQVTQEELERLHSQMQAEMQQPTFRGTWTFMSAWGVNESRSETNSSW